ncbi:MAG TPA: ornithine cyclodeaminase family protein [Terriglobia bacterium]|nr:ornithine cyclodeaminase family protein [Terriglobia bacterium]
MAIFLSEADVQELLPMERALERVEASLLQQHRGTAVNRSRERILLPHTSLHYMAAALTEEGMLGMKVYTVSRETLRFMVLLYDAENGELLALLEADHLGRLRTGAASGVATKYMARPDASRLGLIGSGWQACTQLEAVSRVRKLNAVKVFSRNEARRREFCREMSENLQLAVEPAADAETAARFGDIVVTATTSREPVLRGAWLRLGTHVNAIGANMLNRRELDDEALARAGVIAVDSIEQAREEAGDLAHGLTARPDGWDDIVELHEIVSGATAGRCAEDDVTVFKSSGIALWDVAAAGYVYRSALEREKGRKVG